MNPISIHSWRLKIYFVCFKIPNSDYRLNKEMFNQSNFNSWSPLQPIKVDFLPHTSTKTNSCSFLCMSLIELFCLLGEIFILYSFEATLNQWVCDFKTIQDKFCSIVHFHVLQSLLGPELVVNDGHPIVIHSVAVIPTFFISIVSQVAYRVAAQWLTVPLNIPCNGNANKVPNKHPPFSLPFKSHSKVERKAQLLVATAGAELPPMTSWLASEEVPEIRGTLTPPNGHL